MERSTRRTASSRTSIGQGAVRQPGLERFAVAGSAGELEVEPGAQGAGAGVAPIGGHPVVGDEQLDREVVGHHHAVEAELAAQEVVEDGAAAGAREAVDRRVGVHDRGQAGVADGGRERLGVHLAQLAADRAGPGAWFMPPSDRA